jgi:hypothetical protein
MLGMTMSETDPLERAARAIWEAAGRPYKKRPTKPSMTLPKPEPDWERFLPAARAAFLALREPTEKMQDAAYQFDWSNGGDGESADANAINVFKAMIDAALAGKYP